MIDISYFIEASIGTLSQKRVIALEALSLPELLKQQNPYLLSIKPAQTITDIVKKLVDAHISSNEETFCSCITLFIVNISERLPFCLKLKLSRISQRLVKSQKRAFSVLFVRSQATL